MSLREIGPQSKLPINMRKGLCHCNVKLKNEITTAFDFSVFRQLRPKYIIKIVLIDNLGFKIRMVNSGIKHVFKYEKRHNLIFLWL